MKTRRILSLLLILLLCLPPLSGLAEEEEETPAPELLWSRETPLTETVTLTETVLDNGSRQAEHYLRFVPGGSAQPKLAFGENLLEKLEFSDLLAGSRERVIAGLNGDYFVMSSGMPLGLVVQGGELLASDAGNHAFGFREDGSAFLGKPALRMTLSGRKQTVPVYCFNKSFYSGALCLYSAAWGEKAPAAGETWNLTLVPEEGGLPAIGEELRLFLEAKELSGEAPALEEGKYLLRLSADSDEWFLSFLRSLEPGDALIFRAEAEDERFSECRTALGCLYPLVREGEVEEGLEKIDKSRAPRTSIGILEDGSVLFYTVDGRQSGYSRGLSLEENARRLRELGCVEAGTLDGGASTLLGVQLPGNEACAIVNEPSLGTVRKTPQFLFLTTPAQKAGEVRTIAVFCEEKALLCGSSAAFSFGACDENGAPVFPKDAVWTADRGSMDPEGIYTAPEEAGEALVSVSSGGVTGSLRIPVVAEPDSLAICWELTGRELGSLRLMTGETAELSVRAAWHTFPLHGEDELFAWELEGDLGELSGDGTFTAGDNPGTGKLRVSFGQVQKELDVLITAPVFCAEGFEDHPSGSAEGLRWSQERLRDQAKYGWGSLRLDYDLEDGSAVFPLEGVDTGLLNFASFWLQSDGGGLSIYSVHDDVTLFLGKTDRVGWLPFTVDTGHFGPIRGLQLSGSGQGTLRLDQLVLSLAEELDTEAPVISLTEADGLLTGQVRDLAEGSLPAELLSLTADGEALPFEYDRDTGLLTAILPEGEGCCHVVLKARDHSGNYHSAALYAGDPESAPFADMAAHWARPYVDYLYGQGIVNGRTDGEGNPCFDPNTPMTRAEFAAMLCRWQGLEPVPGEAAPQFADEEDIPAWARDSVFAAASHGLLQGSVTDRGLCFLPREPITRSQAAAILCRTMEAGRMRAVLDFSDAGDIPGWAEGFLSELAFMHVMNGDGVKLDPRGQLTRAQAAKLLSEFT